MKIRITENTLRIRLSNSDLIDLSSLKTVTVSLPIGALEFAIQLQVQQSYIYGAANTTETEFDNESEIHFDHQSINISITSNKLLPWINSSEICFTTTYTNPNNRKLNLIVEKDMMG
jgi:hypothetical protein